MCGALAAHPTDAGLHPQSDDNSRCAMRKLIQLGAASRKTLGSMLTNVVFDPSGHPMGPYKPRM